LSGMRAALLVGGAVELLGAAIALTKVRNPPRPMPGEPDQPARVDEPAQARP